MTTLANHPYDWLKVVEPSLVSSDAVPTTALPDAFSWEALSQLLADHFEISDLSLQVNASGWITEGDEGERLAVPLITLEFAVGNLPGSAYWVISSADSDALLQSLLTKQTSSVQLTDTAFREGFLHYIGAETLVFLNQLGFCDALTPRLIGQQPLPTQKNALCFDISVTVLGRTYVSHLVITQELMNGWKAIRRSTQPKDIPPALAQKIDLIIHLEAGRVTLPHSQWKNIQPGDFIVLDQCSIIPGVDKGRVMLTTGGIPLFRGMLKKEQIKILEYPLYHEVETSMNNDESEENHEDEFSETEELEEETEFESEELEEEEEEVEQESLEEETEEENLGQHVSAEHGSLTSLDTIPLHIVVEVGRLSMTLAKLKELQPGHLLELNVKPEQGVDLTINGRCVGRGELLRVGETLGVRVLELG